MLLPHIKPVVAGSLVFQVTVKESGRHCADHNIGNFRSLAVDLGCEGYFRRFTIAIFIIVISEDCIVMSDF